jgi:hypothetical protein
VRTHRATDNLSVLPVLLAKVYLQVHAAASLGVQQLSTGGKDSRRLAFISARDLIPHQQPVAVRIALAPAPSRKVRNAAAWTTSQTWPETPCSNTQTRKQVNTQPRMLAHRDLQTDRWVAEGLALVRRALSSQAQSAPQCSGVIYTLTAHDIRIIIRIARRAGEAGARKRTKTPTTFLSR